MVSPSTFRHAKVTDDVELMREMVRNALWSIEYHEEALTSAHKRLAIGKSLMERVGLTVSSEEALKRFHEDEDERDFKSSTDFLAYIYGDLLNSIEWHELELRSAHDLLAAVKAMMIRGKYTEFTIDEVAAALKAKKETS